MSCKHHNPSQKQLHNLPPYFLFIFHCFKEHKELYFSENEVVKVYPSRPAPQYKIFTASCVLLFDQILMMKERLIMNGLNITIHHGNNCTTFRHLSFSSSIASRNSKNSTFRKMKKQNRPTISDLVP